MPTRSNKKCSWRRCNNDAVYRGRCREHPVDMRPSPATRGYDYEWQQIREKKLEIDKLCVLCLALGKRIDATDVDHILPIKEGGTNDMENLQSLCHSHHSKKTDFQNKNWRMG